VTGRWLALPVAAALALAACRGEERAAVAAVRAYDAAVIKAYRDSDASAVRGLAAPEELNRLIVLIDLKRAGQLTLMSELQRFEARQVELTPQGATVTTGERWRYHDRPHDPRLPSGDVFLADMVLEYDLVKEGTAWKVRRARTLSSTYLEPKGYQPGSPSRAAPPPPPVDPGAVDRGPPSR
jgi:hypothetical protein